MATKQLTAAQAEQLKEALTAALEPTVSVIVAQTALINRLRAEVDGLRLEVDALFKYNTEYGDYVETAFQPISVKRETVKRTGTRNAWNEALEAVRKAHGHVAGTYEKKDEVLAMMKQMTEAAR